jgi:hypothetical protein
MSDKMTCPGCQAYSSTVLARFRDGQPCKFCGLSAAAAQEIIEIQDRRGDEDLKAKLTEALKRADRAEDQARRLRVHLNDLLSKARSVAEEMEDPEPWLKDW